MEALEEVDVVSIDSPGLRAEKKSGENNSPIDMDLSFTFQTFLVPHSFVSSTEGAIGLGSLLSISLSILASEEMVQPR